MADQNTAAWSPHWEENIYSKGKHLNLYPHHAVVGTILSSFSKVSDRSAIRILEIGSGAGNNLWFAAREGFSVYGIDGSVSAVNFCKERFKKENLESDIRVGDFKSLPWSDNYFDFVLDKGSLECNLKQDIKESIAEASRVLKPGGKFLSITRSFEHPDKKYGKDLGNNDFTGFEEGYFSGLGNIHFNDHKDIMELYSQGMEVISVIHTTEEDRLKSQVINAFYKIECRKI